MFGARAEGEEITVAFLMAVGLHIEPSTLSRAFLICLHARRLWNQMTHWVVVEQITRLIAVGSQWSAEDWSLASLAPRDVIGLDIHDLLMALPPDERRDRAKVNEAVRRERDR